jgi:hypothetical protein
VTYEEAVAFRAELLAADPPARVQLRDDEGPVDNEPGTVVAMTEDLHRQLYGQAGDDVEVMVWVRWSRTYVRPEYVEDLVLVST